MKRNYAALDWDEVLDDNDNSGWEAESTVYMADSDGWEMYYHVSSSLRDNKIVWSVEGSDAVLKPDGLLELFTSVDYAKQWCEHRNRESFDAVERELSSD